MADRVGRVDLEVHGRSPAAVRARAAKLGLAMTLNRAEVGQIRPSVTPPPITPEMIEQLAAAMWESRATAEDPRTWATAGELWHQVYRQLAEVAYSAMRRIEGEQD